LNDRPKSSPSHQIPGLTRRAVLLTKGEARRMQELLVGDEGYESLEHDDRALYDRLEAVR
jgi:hypothetical protein